MKTKDVTSVPSKKIPDPSSKCSELLTSNLDVKCDFFLVGFICIRDKSNRRGEILITARRRHVTNYDLF